MVHAIQNTQQALVAPAASSTPVLGVLIDSDLSVLQVDSKSVAGRAGIRIGDVLTAVNGTSLISAATTRQRIVAALKGATGRQLTLTVLRGGRSLRLVLVLADSSSVTHGNSTPEAPLSYTGAAYYI